MFARMRFVVSEVRCTLSGDSGKRSGATLRPVPPVACPSWLKLKESDREMEITSDGPNAVWIFEPGQRYELVLFGETQSQDNGGG